MTGSDTAGTRANSAGDPCPSWCTQDHEKMLVDGQPQYGRMDGHRSDPAAPLLGLKADVLVRRMGTAEEAPARVCVNRYGTPVLDLAAEKALALAALLELLATKHDVEQLAGGLRAAAAAIAGGA